MLKIPIQVTRKPLNGREHLEIWANGQSHILPAPLRPYLYSKKRMRLDTNDEYTEEQQTVKLLSTFEEIPAYKYSFSEVEYIKRINKQFRGTSEDREILCENHLGFVERVAIDNPDFFLQFPEQLQKVLTLDIETYSENFRHTNRIIAISVKLNNVAPVCFMGDEKQILSQFIDAWQQINPDVVVGYNLKQFDLPIILQRCEEHNLPTGWMQRGTDRMPRIDDGRIHRLKGRALCDVWELVDSDQTLKTKDKKLKTVAPHFGFPAIEEETHNTAELERDPERLRRYCNSDVDATYYLYDIFIQEIIMIANTLQVPFDMVLNPGGSKGKKKSKMGRAREGISMLLGRIVTGRGMVQKGYIEDGLNRHRYPNVIVAPKGNYQGATVSLMAPPGVYKNVVHWDFAGMYPAIQMSTNCSPETTKIIGYEPYDSTVDLVRERVPGQYTIFVIPDNKIMRTGRNVIIEVDQSFTGVVPEMLQSLNGLRVPIKAQEKAAKAAGKSYEQKKFRSSQYGLKIIGNACGYGANAPGEVRYGNFSNAVLITGLGRYLLDLACAFATTKFGFKVIERDTDGIYFLAPEGTTEEQVEVHLETINQYISQQVMLWGIASVLHLESDIYPLAFFHAMKNYVLLDKQDKLKFVGVAFKSSQKPKVYDTVKEQLARLKLTGADHPTIRRYIRGIMEIDRWTIAELTMRRTISKYPHQYANNDLGARLALKAEKHLGIEPEPFTQYQYVFAKSGISHTNGYALAAIASHDELDKVNYRSMLSDLCGLFGWRGFSKHFIRHGPDQQDFEEE